MDTDAVMAWVAGYERAWREDDLAGLDRLFTDDAQYPTSPYSAPWNGLAAIREHWSDDGPFEMSAEPVAVEDRSAVVRVLVRYVAEPQQEYLDLWVLRFAEDGRVEHFEEWAYWPDKPFSATQ